MGFKESLDKYLTTPPEDNFSLFAEEVSNSYSENFWRSVYEVPVNMRNRFENSEPETKWLNKLFDKGIAPALSAKIIERAHRIFVKTKLKRKFKH